MPRRSRFACRYRSAPTRTESNSTRNTKHSTTDTARPGVTAATPQGAATRGPSNRRSSPPPPANAAERRRTAASSTAPAARDRRVRHDQNPVVADRHRSKKTTNQGSRNSPPGAMRVISINTAGHAMRFHETAESGGHRERHPKQCRSARDDDRFIVKTKERPPPP